MNVVSIEKSHVNVILIVVVSNELVSIVCTPFYYILLNVR